jgi:hypothetical protein
MVETRDFPQSAILDLELTDDISAYALYNLISLLNNSYFDWLYFDLAEQSDSGTPFPDDWIPARDQELWISQLTIGTPNSLQLLGNPDALQYVHDLLSQIINHPIEVTSVAVGMMSGASATVLGMAKSYKTYWEGRKAQLEARMLERGARLEEKRKISPEMLSLKQRTPPVEHYISAAALIKWQKLKKPRR